MSWSRGKEVDRSIIPFQDRETSLFDLQKKKTWEWRRDGIHHARSATTFLRSLTIEMSNGLHDATLLEDFLLQLPTPEETAQIELVLEEIVKVKEKEARHHEAFLDLEGALRDFLIAFLHMNVNAESNSIVGHSVSHLTRRKRGDFEVSGDYYDSGSLSSSSDGSYQRIVIPIDPNRFSLEKNEYGLCVGKLEQVESLFGDYLWDPDLVDLAADDVDFVSRYLRVLLTVRPRDWFSSIDKSVARLNHVAREMLIRSSFDRLEKKKDHPPIEEQKIGEGSYSNVAMITHRSGSVQREVPSTYKVVLRTWQNKKREGKHAPYEAKAFAILGERVRNGHTPHFPLRIETIDYEVMEVSDTDLDFILSKMSLTGACEDYRQIPHELFHLDPVVRDKELLGCKRFGHEHKMCASLLVQCIEAVCFLFKVGISHGDLYSRNILVEKIRPSITMSYRADDSLPDIVVPTFGLLIKITDFGLCFGEAIERDYSSFDRRTGKCAFHPGKKHVMRLSEKRLPPGFRDIFSLYADFCKYGSKLGLMLFSDLKRNLSDTLSPPDFLTLACKHLVFLTEGLQSLVPPGPHFCVPQQPPSK